MAWRRATPRYATPRDQYWMHVTSRGPAWCGVAWEQPASAGWSEMEDKLIFKVYQREVLYKNNSAQYRDQHVRNEAWEEIGQELNLTAAECKETWSKLRNCFLNAIKRRRPTKNGQAAKQIPKWKYEDNMSFLLPYITARQKHSSLGSQPRAKVPDAEESTVDSDGNAPLKRDDGQDDTFSIFTGRRSKQSAAEEMWTERLGDFSGQDATELFYLSMAKTVKRLPVVDQAKIRLELCRLVSEAEIRQMEYQYAAHNLPTLS